MNWKIVLNKIIEVESRRGRPQKLRINRIEEIDDRKGKRAEAIEVLTRKSEK